MKKTVALLVLAAATVSLAFIPKNAEDRFVVVLDAGHGGKDHGVSHNSDTEKFITEQVSKKIRQLNSDAEIAIHLTRDADEFKDLGSRTAMINSLDADLVLSLHVQGHKNPQASGMELYVGKDNPQKTKSLEYAEKLSAKLQKNHAINMRPAKEAPFYVLKNSNAPAVMLELGFLTNERDRNYLTSEKEQDKIARTISEFIRESK